MKINLSYVAREIYKHIALVLKAGTVNTSKLFHLILDISQIFNVMHSHYLLPIIGSTQMKRIRISGPQQKQ